MIQWAVIITILLCLVLGFYTIILLQQERKKYNKPYLTSFFYYQILVVLFGVYGILGNILIREILPKFGVNYSGIETIAQLFPFIGLPFLIAAWFLKIKMASELCLKKTNQWIAVVYFLLTTIAFLVYGLTIKNIPNLNINFHADLRKYIFLGFALVELAIEGYIVSYLFINALRPKLKTKKKLLSQFALIIISVTILKAASLYFSQIHVLIGLYFLLLYFIGNLPLVVLLKVFLTKQKTPQQADNSMDAIFSQYKITPREKEIILEICLGKTNKQIAESLFISLQTVKDHTHNIFQKTEVSNRVQLTQLFNAKSPE